MKNRIILKAFFLSLFMSSVSVAANTIDHNTDKTAGQQPASLTYQQQSDELLALSKKKWEWMADKNVAELEVLFHTESKFVHMSGTWKKARELEIIESGSIWYKNTVVHDTDIEIIGNTAVIWSRITLEAHVRGNDVANEFTSTEVYVKIDNRWLLLDLTFSGVRDTHEIEH